MKRRCAICRHRFPTEAFATPTQCIECDRTCKWMSEAHADDWAWRQKFWTPDREARIELYEKRAEQNLPLFEDAA